MHYELVEWYENAGYNALYPQSAKSYRELFKRQILGIDFLGVRKK